MVAHIRRLDWLLVGSASLLMLLGNAALFIMWRQGGDHDIFIQFVKQMLFSLLAIAAIILASTVDYRIFRREPWVHLILYGFLVSLLVLVLVVGRRVHGASSWLSLGPFVLQPVEFGKLIILLFLSRFFSLRHIELYRFSHLVLSGLYVALPISLIMLQPDLGSALLFGALWLGVLVLSGLPLKRLALLGLGGVIGLIILWTNFFAPYQKDRILVFLSPASDPLRSGYHLRQGLAAVSDAGALGRWSSDFTQAGLGFLPESATDFMFAAYVEEFGFLGWGILFFLFALLSWRMSKTFFRATNNFSRVFSGGLLIWIFIQSAVHIGMNLGLVPVIGISLPFLSAGGSNLLALALGIGILESIRLHQPVLRGSSDEE